MRSLVILVTFLLCAHLPAHADSVVDLSQPSSTVPGCLNYWSPLDSRFSPFTCEGKAETARWQERQTAISNARNVITSASRDPERISVQAVIAALDTCAAASDGIATTYHPRSPSQNAFDGTLSWMRQRFEAFHLPIPDSVGDGFRILAHVLDNPRLLKVERNDAYDRAAVVASALNDAVTESIETARQTMDAAVFAAHQAAVEAAQQAENANYNPAASAAAIRVAAGPDHAALAEEQTRALNASVGKHPGQSHYVARAGRKLLTIPGELVGLLSVCAFFALASFKLRMVRYGFRSALEGSLLFMGAACLSWLPMAVLLSLGVLPDGIWPGVLWLALFGVLFVGGTRILPTRLREGWFAFFSLFGGQSALSTHGTARFGRAEDATAAGHLAPSAPANNSFVLGWLRGTSQLADGRFRQGGHILTCAPTGSGKGLGAVIPNLLSYPGSAFVLDLKGENYAVTARARREAGQDVFLIDPFGITGARGHSMNWLDALNPDDPDVVALAGALADMLIVSSGAESDPHWNDTAKELVRGLLIYVAGLPPERRSMSELRRIVTSSEDDWAEVLADMLDDPDRGQRLVARTATAHLNRPEKERGSVLSTVVRQTTWLDDPRLATAFSRSDFDLRDLKRHKMTVYLALPPNRLRACLGFVRGFIGLALDAMTSSQGKPAEGVAFFLDEFGQLGRMDSLADNITLLRGYGAQFWLFIQDLSQLQAVYPRWRSFLANTTQQYFGTADYDTAKYISDALGQFTIRFQTTSQSSQTGFTAKPGGGSAGTGEHLQGRSLLTPDEVMRLGPTRPIVMISGEAPYLLDRIDYRTDVPYVGLFDPNPMYALEAAE